MNLFKRTVASKISLVILSIVTFILVVNGLNSYWFNKEVVIEANTNKLNSLIDFQERRLQSAIDEMGQDLKFIEGNDLLKKLISRANAGIIDSLERARQRQNLNEGFFSKIVDIHDYEDIIITDYSGTVLYQQSDLDLEKVPFKKHLNRRTSEFYFDRMMIEGGEAFTYASRPIKDSLNETIGIVYCKADLILLLKEITYIGEYSKDITISYGIKVLDQVTQYIVTVEKGFDNPSLIVYEDDKPVFLSCTGNSGDGFFTNHRDEEILTAYRPIQLFNIGIVAEIHKSSIYGGLRNHFVNISLEAFVLFWCSLGVGLLLIKNINNGLNPISIALYKLSKGSFPPPLEIATKDEFLDISVVINNHVNRLKESSDFADQIGNGDLSSGSYKPISEHDTLGLKLIKMKKNLRDQDETDSNRAWVMTGLAEVNGVLRDVQNVSDLSDTVIKYLSIRIGAINGKIFLIDKGVSRMTMESAFAFDKKKALERTVYLQGIISPSIILDVFKEQQTIYRTEVPDNYYFIPSGLKEETGPRSVLLVPLISEDKIYGVIDFASYSEFSPTEISFIEEVSEIVARTIFNIEINQRTKMLLESSQQMSNELQEKQAILQENAIEMEKKSQEIELTNEKLEKQITEVNHAQNRIHILLEKASEVITIYDEERIVRYISPSVESILGYDQEEMLGSNDINHVSTGHQEQVREMFNQLLNDTDTEYSVTFSFYKKDGEEIWLQARGKNMLKDPSIHGIVINTSDITERRRAEEEQRKRGQMQALSENSLDLITRVDADGSFFYINPTIEALTGYKADKYLNQKITEVGLNEDVAEVWSLILDSVIQSKTKKSCEMGFPTIDGEKIMMVNAIPEFDADEDRVESVLLVSHDITESKKKENEIKLKNKKINDSINYAERIQSTILPDNELLRQLLPKSFMIFRPRDVVSGDFPWIFHYGDEVILAAVDCTGHGVPGAMISLVGYFLLNEAVVAKEIYEPGKVLDELDLLVTNTFRQNSEKSQIKDGMDVAICRINTKTGRLDYAGAHRPMYVVRKDGDEVEQLKGDKFPIGGGAAFKNKTHFQNMTVQLERGDAFYFFSDGLPDQFGGPNDRKLGPKRIRSFVQEKKGIDMLQMESEMDNFLLDWKGDDRQFDDIIIFGVEF
jgi:PAS domain S-box-containing protein